MAAIWSENIGTVLGEHVTYGILRKITWFCDGNNETNRKYNITSDISKKKQISAPAKQSATRPMDDERTIGETPQGARRRLACRGTGGGRPATRGGPAVQPERRAAGGSAGAGSGATCRRRRRHPELVWRGSDRLSRPGWSPARWPAAPPPSGRSSTRGT